MTFSLRRVAGALVAVSVLSSVGTFIVTGSTVCSGTDNCLAAVALGGVSTYNPKTDVAVAKSTPMTYSPSDYAFFPHGVELVSVYGLLLSLILLGLMEIYSPRSFKTHIKTPRYRH